MTITWRQVEEDQLDGILYTSHVWTIELTDGRQTRRLGEGHLEPLFAFLNEHVSYHRRLRFVEMCLTRTGEQEFVKAHNVYWVLEPDHLVWEDKHDEPVLGTVRSVVRWSREEVKQVVRAAMVAKRLRASSEPHTETVQ